MQHYINLGDTKLLRLHLGEDGESIKMQMYVNRGIGRGGGVGGSYHCEHLVMFLFVHLVHDLLTIITRINARKRKQTA